MARSKSKRARRGKGGVRHSVPQPRDTRQYRPVVSRARASSRYRAGEQRSSPPRSGPRPGNLQRTARRVGRDRVRWHGPVTGSPRLLASPTRREEERPTAVRPNRVDEHRRERGFRLSVCAQRSQRRQSLFARGIAGKNRKLSPGKSGGYARTLRSLIKCSET